MKIYTLDSNIIINMKNDKPYEYFPSLWDGFEQLIAENRLVSLDVVYKELVYGNDYSEQWARSHKDIFKPLEEQTIIETKDIVNKFPIIKLDSERDQADPYLIAFSKVNGYCLLSDEKGKQNRTDIPNVCTALGVDCINLFGLMKEESWKF